MIIVILPQIFKKKFSGMTVYPFVFLKNKMLKHDKTVMNHERIHLRQQLELLWLPFFIWYSFEFLIRWIQYGDRHDAYLNICFEREAYAQERDFEYLKYRRLWSFTKYL